MIGMDAEMVQSLSQPTMVLSLGGQPRHIQKSLVIHMFGHALGLDHEHQRSDFWDLMGKYFDRQAIPENQQSRVLKKTDILDGECVLKYDPNSIMHYWSVLYTQVKLVFELSPHFLVII